MQLHDFIDQVRRTTPGAEDRLTFANEKRQIGRLTRYLKDIHVTKAAYKAGTLDRSGLPRKVQARGAAFHEVNMTTVEAEAARVLYASLLGQVAKITRRVWEKNGERGELMDLMSESFECFLRTLAEFDPSQGTRLSTYVGTDYAARVQSVIDREGMAEAELEALPHPCRVASRPGDIEELIDLRSVAEEVATSDDVLGRLWERLTEEADAEVAALA